MIRNRKRNDRMIGPLAPPERNRKGKVAETRPQQEIRLQLLLAQAGIASRRKVEEFIRQGRVRVDGRVVSQPGWKVDPSVHDLELDGRRLTIPTSKTYYLYHKPRGILSTLRDPQGRPTLQDALHQAGIHIRLFPVGRLDWDAEGLLLLTNDGKLANFLQHPRYQVPKTYRVKVKGLPADERLNRLRSGILLPSGKRHRADWERIKTGKDRAWLYLTVREGEKHQVKNMLAAIGHPVLRLQRVSLGPLRLGNLPRGKIRPLRPGEIEALQRLMMEGRTADKEGTGRTNPGGTVGTGQCTEKSRRDPIGEGIPSLRRSRIDASPGDSPNRGDTNKAPGSRPLPDPPAGEG